MVAEPCVKKVCQTICEMVTDPCVKIVPVTVCEMQTIQCVRKVPYTTCRQVAETKTICCPVTVARQVTDYKTVCVPRTVCKQVPVEVCVKVPVVVHCPPVVHAFVTERAGVEPVDAVHDGAAVRPLRQPLPALAQAPPRALSGTGRSRNDRFPTQPDRQTPRRDNSSPGAFRLIELVQSSGRVELAAGDHACQIAAEPGERAGAMAELVLDERAQLAEGLVILGDQKERIVAEAAGAAGLARQPPAAEPLGSRAGSSRSGQPAPRRSETPRRDRSSAIVVHGRQQLAIVGRVVAGLAGVARREDAGRTVQGVDRQAGIVGEDPAAERRASSAAFLRALPANVSASSTTSGAPGNSSTERISSRASRAIRLPRRGDQLGHLAAFLAVARAQDQHDRMRRMSGGRS